MQRWAGRVALVTGASSGIGLELAEALANHGMKVVGCARNIPKIQELADKVSSDSAIQGSVLPISCDVAKEEDILAMFAKIKAEYGGLDVCVNNAGVSHQAPLISGPTDKFREMLEVNVLGLSICTREAVQSMKEKGVNDGHIINMNSGCGHYVSPGYDATFYAATKFAVTALTEGLRQELRGMKSNIRVSAVSPGLVKTDFAIRMRGDAGQKMYDTQPILYAKDIVDAIIYQLAAPPHVQIHDQIINPVCRVEDVKQ